MPRYSRCIYNSIIEHDLFYDDIYALHVTISLHFTCFMYGILHCTNIIIMVYNLSWFEKTQPVKRIERWYIVLFRVRFYC